MQKILRMLVRLRQLHKRLTREEAFYAIRECRPYSLIIIDHTQNSLKQLEFTELKDAMSHIYEACDTHFNKEFLVYTNTSKGTRFLKFNPIIS